MGWLRNITSEARERNWDNAMRARDEEDARLAPGSRRPRKRDTGWVLPFPSPRHDDDEEE